MLQYHEEYQWQQGLETLQAFQQQSGNPDCSNAEAVSKVLPCFLQHLQSCRHMLQLHAAPVTLQKELPAITACKPMMFSSMLIPRSITL